MTVELSKNFHGVGIGPISKILAVKYAWSFGWSKTILNWSKYFWGEPKSFLDMGQKAKSSSEMLYFGLPKEMHSNLRTQVNFPLHFSSNMMVGKK